MQVGTAVARSTKRGHSHTLHVCFCFESNLLEALIEGPEKSPGASESPPDGTSLGSWETAAASAVVCGGAIDPLPLRPLRWLNACAQMALSLQSTHAAELCDSRSPALGTVYGVMWHCGEHQSLLVASGSPLSSLAGQGQLTQLVAMSTEQLAELPFTVKWASAGANVWWRPFVYISRKCTRESSLYCVNWMSLGRRWFALPKRIFLRETG